MSCTRWWFLVGFLLNVAGVVGCNALAREAGPDRLAASVVWTVLMYAHALVGLGNLGLLWLGDADDLDEK